MKYTKLGKRKVPLIEKESIEVKSDEITDALFKHGAVMIKHPRFDAEIKRLKKRKVRKVV
jgi:hypothetical protein